ncbi:MAG: metallophosphoesterase [Pseudomonadota bacterium]
MKIPAHNPHDALWQAACARALHKHEPGHSTHQIDTHAIMQQVNSHVHQDLATLLQEDDNISKLFMSLAYAEHNHDRQQTERIKQKLQALQPHFTWEQSKNLFKSYLMGSAGAPVYRDWRDSDQKLNFSVVDYRLPDDAKIGIVGDWGTGADDAKALLEELLTEHKIDLLLHLGDIYFACLEEEMLYNFYNPIQDVFQKTGQSVPIFTIPGNHEYYAGGLAFYQLIDQLNDNFGEDYKQQASYFCLRSESDQWQILGIDTAYREALQNVSVNDKKNYDFDAHYPGILDTELEWHKHKLDSFSGKTLVLSHHGLLSAKTPLNKPDSTQLAYLSPPLLQQLGDSLADIHLWIWGHEHDFTLFKKNLALPNNTTLRNACLLGGSARDTLESKALPLAYPEIAFHDAKGKAVEAGSCNGYSNHTYGVLDLGANKIAYYQIPAWSGTERKPLPSGQNKCLIEVCPALD